MTDTPAPNPMPIEFWECHACARKPGTPRLCERCIQNRTAIERLTIMVVEGQRLISISTKAAIDDKSISIKTYEHMRQFIVKTGIVP